MPLGASQEKKQKTGNILIRDLYIAGTSFSFLEAGGASWVRGSLEGRRFRRMVFTRTGRPAHTGAKDGMARAVILARLGARVVRRGVQGYIEARRYPIRARRAGPRTWAREKERGVGGAVTLA